ncbi:tetratricopeptide repeat protein [Streptomyces buecherae]|uniref:Tetratricopeptide repeat protein n=1 Tax=Streptomyces buecherae TaxID=2763006 RepID=A0A7H8N148_9ACTN|nr:tetratricopeptide repeat protein [Streptomyces buecherae]QKW48204.1 tetratricopeptide repeat protein [Streptomyces buecherae]QKW54126.1 tetratricopeptide repeat protein [Streptomyces buecherae]
MRRFRMGRSSGARKGSGEAVPSVSVSDSGDATAVGGGDALSGYWGSGRQALAGGGAVRMERSGDAIASGAHAVAISGHVSQVLLSAPPPSRPLEWPIRLGSVPVLASAFQARSAVRDRIDRARDGHATVVLAQVLSGGGGVGKTQLAAAYAHQALVDGVDLVVWVDASDIEQVLARYAHAAHAVEAASDRLLGKSVESDAGLFLQWLATTRRSWLIVLDDLTEPEAMQAWWPPSSAFGCGRVVATTRRHGAVLSGGGRAVVDIDTYSAEEVEAYLHERLSSAHADHLLDAQAVVLAETLGFLPLALSHAAAFMVNEDVPCAEYLRRFNDSAARLDDLLPREADTEGYGRQVAAALLLSLDVAQASEPVGLAVPVMRLAAVLGPAGHPRSLWASDAVVRYLSTQRTTPPDGAPTAIGPAQAQAALRLLHRYGLLTDHAQAGCRAVRLHALTARAVRECTPDAVVSEVVKTAAGALTELCDTVLWDDHETRAALLTNIDSLNACAGNLLWQVDGHYVLRWAGRSMALDTAIPYWQLLVGTSERQLGRAHPLTLVARRDLAWVCFGGRRGKDAFAVLQEDFPYQDNRLALEGKKPTAAGQEAVSAVALLEDTVAVRQRLLGQADPATLTGQADLALLYWSQGDRPAAIDVLERSLAGYRATYGLRHPYTISVDNRLSNWREQHKRRWWRRTVGPSAPDGPAGRTAT